MAADAALAKGAALARRKALPPKTTDAVARPKARRRRCVPVPREAPGGLRPVPRRTAEVQPQLHLATKKERNKPMIKPVFILSGPPRFTLGQIVATPGVFDACPPARLNACLARHARGDWGIVCDEDKATNDQAFVEGLRLLSAYAIDPAQPAKGYGDNCLWIITEADRSATTFLLPSEY
jgi:hypothetical protein